MSPSQNNSCISRQRLLFPQHTQPRKQPTSDVAESCSGALVASLFRAVRSLGIDQIAQAPCESSQDGVFYGGMQSAAPGSRHCSLETITVGSSPHLTELVCYRHRTCPQMSWDIGTYRLRSCQPCGHSEITKQCALSSDQASCLGDTPPDRLAKAVR